MEVKAKVSYDFYVDCPYCGAWNKFRPIESSEGDELKARLQFCIEAFKNGEVADGETCVVCECCRCQKDFTIVAFNL